MYDHLALEYQQQGQFFIATPKFSSILIKTLSDWTALAQKIKLSVEIGTIVVAIKRFAANRFKILF